MAGRPAPVAGAALAAALVFALAAGAAIPGCPLREAPAAGGPDADRPVDHPGAPPASPWIDDAGRIVRIEKTDAQWRATLSPLQYRILRRKGTEPPYRNAYWDHAEEGVYSCAGCGLPLFDSKDKIASCSGWPSFGAPVDPRHVEEIVDRSHGMARVEAVCARCGGHLGHVFEDGPPPSGRRY